MMAGYVCRMEAASRGERGRIITEIEQLYGWSRDTVYRRLREAGWSSGRRRRRDASDTAVDADDLDLLAALLKTGIRKNGKVVKDIPTARNELEISGVRFAVTNSRLAALLRDRGIDLKTQKAPTPHVRMRSLHPNHVHQVDPSMCLLYYLPSGGQRLVDDTEVYKNKPFMEGKSHLKIWRYVLTDHYSASVCVRYYQRAGEQAATLWDFLLYAWGEKREREYLFHGVPEILVMDKGSANIGGGISNGLASLRVTPIPHTTGNPRAKGQVEKMNHLVEKFFESRLRTDPVAGLDELNERAAWWCAAYNANDLVGVDSTLRRAGRSRLEIWAGIGSDELRELPGEARSLMAGEPITRRVGGDLAVSYKHPRIGESRPYHLGGLEGVRPGIVVRVQPMLMEDTGVVRVLWMYQGEEFAAEVAPELLDDVGQWADGPVWGEGFKANPDTYVDEAAKRLQALIGEDKRPMAAQFGGEGVQGIRGMSRRDDGVRYMPRSGGAIRPEPDVPTVTINPVAAALRLKKRLSGWRREYLDVIRENFPEGVPESGLDELAAALRAMGRDDDLTASVG